MYAVPMSYELQGTIIFYGRLASVVSISGYHAAIDLGLIVNTTCIRSRVALVW
jgi:hypothetical protein